MLMIWFQFIDKLTIFWPIGDHISLRGVVDNVKVKDFFWESSPIWFKKDFLEDINNVFFLLCTDDEMEEKQVFSNIWNF